MGGNETGMAAPLDDRDNSPQAEPVNDFGNRFDSIY